MRPDQIELAKTEYASCKQSINRHKKSPMYKIPMFVLLSFIMPYVPVRSGSLVLLKYMSYQSAVIVYSIAFLILYLFIHIYQKEKHEKKLRELKLKVYLAEKAGLE
ncbi:MAG: hypothetical protein JXR07_19235 [Reichenbachiella sp.]